MHLFVVGDLIHLVHSYIKGRLQSAYIFLQFIYTISVCVDGNRCSTFKALLETDAM